MSHEVVIAMNVTDPARYAQYRAGMTPVLSKYGGGFRYDLVVSQVLKSPTTHPITRVFALYFRDTAAMQAFFADPDYIRVRADHFTVSTDGYSTIAEHDRPD